METSICFKMSFLIDWFIIVIILIVYLSRPQVELHVHLDGAIRVQTILDVAK